MYKKGKWLFSVIAVSLMLCCSGCGNSQNENIALGMEAIQNLDYSGAIELFDKALVSGEDARLVYRGQGLAYMGMVQYEEAVSALEKALSATKQVSELEFDVNYYLATAYYKNGDIDNAIKTYDAILGMRTTEKDAHYLRGTLKLKKGDYENAVVDFDAAITLAPTDYALYIDIYKSLEANGYQEIGQGYLQKALEGDAKSVTDYDRGRISYYLKDYENARNYLEKAGESGGYEAMLALGKTYEALGDNNYAASVYSKYLETDQTKPEVYNQLGLCKLSLKEYDIALSAFQSGIAIENNALIQSMKFNEIVTYEYLGDFKKATVLMESYLATYPGDEAAVREYEFLKTR